MSYNYKTDSPVQEESMADMANIKGLHKDPVICLMTVFIPREHIFFLEEWIRHHLTVGVQHIFLYDNGIRFGEQRSPELYIFNPKFKRKWHDGLSKHNENYAAFTSHWTDDDIARMTLEIVNKFPMRVSLVPWHPVDKKGRVIYGQKLAFEQYF